MLPSITLGNQNLVILDIWNQHMLLLVFYLFVLYFHNIHKEIFMAQVKQRAI